MSEFEEAGNRGGGMASEIWLFLKQNKKWWLLPLIAVIVVFGVLVFLAGTGAAPFIYTLF
jgi:Family of unknown function (DUF5989)